MLKPPVLIYMLTGNVFASAITAQGRISGIIVASITVFVGTMILFIDPGYLEPLVTKPVGWLLIGFCIMSEFLGFVFMKKIMTIDF